MVELAKKQEFIELRAQGWSYSKIADKIRVSKPVLIKWCKELTDQVSEHSRAVAEDMAKNLQAGRLEQIKFYAEQRNRIHKEIAKRNLKDVPTEKLFQLSLNNDRQINLLLDSFGLTDDLTPSAEEKAKKEAFQKEHEQLDQKYNQALEFIYTNQMDEALAELEKVIKLNPHYEQVWRYKAEVLLEQQQLDQALAAVEKALYYHSPSPELYYLKAQIHISRNEANLALDTIERGVCAFPRDTMLSMLNIQALLMNKQMEQIEFAWRTCAENIRHEKDPRIINTFNRLERKLFKIILSNPNPSQTLKTEPTNQTSREEESPANTVTELKESLPQKHDLNTTSELKVPTESAREIPELQVA